MMEGGEMKSDLLEKEKSVPRFDSCCFFPYPKNSLYPMHTYSPSENKFRLEPNKEYLRPSLSIVAGERLGVDLSALLSNPAGGRDYLVRNNGDRVPVSDALSAEYDEYEQEAAFNHFFSVFSCLAVPFSDEESRHAIIKLIGLSRLVLDPEQKVLNINADYCLYDYGAAAFPFTKDHLLPLKRKEEELKMRLDPIYRETRYSAIGFDPGFYSPKDSNIAWSTSLSPWRNSYAANLIRYPWEIWWHREQITVSQLSKKRCVLLYLCYNGYFMEEVDSLCNKYGNKYEIVFISLPIDSDESCYSDALEMVLGKYKISSSSSWWQLSLADEVLRRLFRLGRVTSYISDCLITWADGGTSGELNALPLIRYFAYDDTYPCTRKQLLDERLSCVRSLTIESFLGQKPRLCSFDDFEVFDL